MIKHNRLLETGLLEGLEFGDVMVDELADALEVRTHNLTLFIIVMCTRYMRL
jgi:predicted DNA-binding ribbon-helix-helix protein